MEVLMKIVDVTNLYVEEIMWITGMIATIIWLLSNIYMITLGYHEVKDNLWDSQNLAGKILAGMFFMPAWIITSTIYDIKEHSIRKQTAKQLEKLYEE